MFYIAPGCKFQNELHGDWNFTYIHAHSLVIRETTMTLILLDGHSMVFICDTRDSSNYVIRSVRINRFMGSSGLCMSSPLA